MSDSKMQDTWHEAMIAGLDGFKQKLSLLKIPMIEGELLGSGHTLIECKDSFLEVHQDMLISNDSIAVFSVEHFDEGVDLKKVKGLKVSVRIGTTNCWFYFNFSHPTNDSDDDIDDFEMDDEPAIESGVLSEVAHHVAQSEDFSKLKNKGQRQAFVERLLQSKAYEAIPNYYAGEISQRAEGIYEFGVLPGRVKSLLNQGKSILEASKYLGISKQKAERAVAMQTPDFIAEMMKDEEQGSVGSSKF